MILLRPHHGLCIHHFEGKGYSPSFINTMSNLISKLESDPEQIIQVVCNCDDICSTCPNNNYTICNTNAKVLSYDYRCLTLCNLQENEQLSWLDFKRKLHKHVLKPQKLSKVCLDCEWLSLCLSKEGQ